MLFVVLEKNSQLLVVVRLAVVVVAAAVAVVDATAAVVWKHFRLLGVWWHQQPVVWLLSSSPVF